MSDNDLIQQQLIAARRTQILQAATKVFAEKGFSRATIRDVAAAAGIAAGTIYNYFPNKTALLLGLLSQLNETEQRHEQFEQSATMDAAAFIESYIAYRFAKLGDGGFDVLQVLLSEVLIDHDLRQMYAAQVVEPTMTLAEQYFKQWAEQGVTKPLDPALMPRLLAGTVLGMIMLRLLGDRSLEARWDEVPQAVSAMFLHGLMAQTGGSDATDHHL